jgi:hypothetical protein
LSFVPIVAQRPIFSDTEFVSTLNFNIVAMFVVYCPCEHVSQLHN